MSLLSTLTRDQHKYVEELFYGLSLLETFFYSPAFSFEEFMMQDATQGRYPGLNDVIYAQETNFQSVRRESTQYFLKFAQDTLIEGFLTSVLTKLDIQPPRSGHLTRSQPFPCLKYVVNWIVANEYKIPKADDYLIMMDDSHNSSKFDVCMLLFFFNIDMLEGLLFGLLHLQSPHIENNPVSMRIAATKSYMLSRQYADYTLLIYDYLQEHELSDVFPDIIKFVLIFTSTMADIKVEDQIKFEDVTIASVRKNIKKYYYLAPVLKEKYPDISRQVLTSSEVNWDILYKIPKEHFPLFPKEVGIAIVKVPDLLYLMSMEMRLNHPEILLAAIKQDGSTVRHLDETTLLMYPQLAEEALRGHLTNVRYIPTECLKQNKNLLALLFQNPSSSAFESLPRDFIHFLAAEWLKSA